MQLNSARVGFIMQLTLRRPTVERRWLITAIVCSGVFMSSLDLFIVNIAFPSIAHSLGDTSLSSLSWVVSGYAIVFAALLVPAGRWADAFGRKRAFQLGLAIFALASAACAVGAFAAGPDRRADRPGRGRSDDAPDLARSDPPRVPAARAPPGDRCVGRNRRVAAAAGPPLGGLLVQADWRLVFLVNVPVAIVALLAGRRTLVERREQNALAPDLLGAVGFALAITALVLAIVKAPDWGWFAAPTVTLVLISAALLAGIWRRSQRHPSPIVDPAMLRVPTFTLAVAGSVLFFAGFAAMLLGGVLFLTGVWHESVLTTGLMLFPGPLMASMFSIPSARLGARVGYRVPGMIGGLMFAGASLWWITQVHSTPAYLSEYLPGMLVSGAGVGLMIPTLTGAGTSSLTAGPLRDRRRRADDGPSGRAPRSASRSSSRCSAQRSGCLELPLGVVDQRTGGLSAALTLALVRPIAQQPNSAGSRRSTRPPRSVRSRRRAAVPHGTCRCAPGSRRALRRARHRFGLDVVTDHRGVGCATPSSASTCSKKLRAGLPTTYACRPEANSIAATNGPTSSERPSLRSQ